jgi:hypothetical protein
MEGLLVEGLVVVLVEDLAAVVLQVEDSEGLVVVVLVEEERVAIGSIVSLFQ